MSFRVVAAQSALQSWQLSAHLQRNTEDLKAPSFSSAHHGAAVIHKHFQNRGWTRFLFCVGKCVYESRLGFITRVAASSFNPVLSYLFFLYVQARWSEFYRKGKPRGWRGGRVSGCMMEAWSDDWWVNLWKKKKYSVGNFGSPLFVIHMKLVHCGHGDFQRDIP